MPRPAACAILLRGGGKHGSSALEVLMLRRNPEARAFANAWVFPGGGVDDADGADDESARRCAVRELAEEVGVQLEGPEVLVPFSRWIAPEQIPVRFDTHFYLARSPAHAELRPDGVEAVEARWIEPREALALHGEGEMTMAFPTVKHLEALAKYTSAEEALEAARRREPPTIQPEVLFGDGDPRPIMPGEPGYERTGVGATDRWPPA